jgi:mannan endo-1,4-beta-mannosidase
MKIIMPFLLLLSSSAFSQFLYDGEAFPFSQAVKWDNNSSVLEESVKLPFSKPKHIRTSIVSVNYWGAAGYVFDNWMPIDFSNNITLSFALRSSQKDTLLGIQLHDITGKTSSFARVETKYNYETIVVPLSMFADVDLKNITAVIFSLSKPGTTTQIIDIDDIELFGKKKINPISGVMTTRDKTLLDACGKEVVLKGVNHMTVYTDWIGTPRDGLPMYEEIAKTGANTVRIVWSYKENTTAKELDNAITNAAKNKLFPMVEVLDRTCQWSREAFDEILAFWLKPEILSVLKKHEKYLLLNFANELGNNVTTLETYKSEYKRAVEKLRAAGVRSPIVIDAPGCGQDEDTMLKAANYLINSDPLHNIVMSLHLWWVPQNDERITKLFTESARLNIPLVIGEFSGLAVDCKTPTSVSHILKLANDHKVGWLPWSWDSANGCKEHSMTTDNTFNGLFGYGKEVAVTHSYSIKNTAVRSQCF